MPSGIFDVRARVIANRRLSSDYNVLALAAPTIAARAAPGQFVMLKAGSTYDPLLRRPFSIFEILRDRHGTPSGISVLSKRIGASTRLFYDAEPGQTVATLGPLGRPFMVVDRPTEAWMVAGGVGLAPFATLAETLRSHGVGCTLFYGARRATELFHLDFFRALGVDLVLSTEDGSFGNAGTLSRRSSGRSCRGARPRASWCTPVGQSACWPRLHGRPQNTSDRARFRSNGLWAAGSVAATAASSPCATTTASIMSAHASPDLSCRPIKSYGIDPGRSLGSHRHASSRESPHRRERLLRLRRRVYGRGGAIVARRDRLEGTVPRGTGRPPCSAHRRNTRRHAQRDRPAGNWRPPFH